MKRIRLLMVIMLTALGLQSFAQSWTSSDLANGRYVFYNIGSGRYLGPGNSWGTQASLIQFSHYNTLAKKSDGVYTIESQVSNGSTNYYFTGSYMDGAAADVTIQDNGEGIFTMSNGTTYYGYDGSSTVLASNLADPSNANAQWKIMAYDEAYANATVDNPADLTYMILDSNFDRNNRNGGGEHNDLGNKWTMVASNQNLCGGTNDNKCAESYHSTFTLSQTITNHPAGVYKLTAQGFYRQDGQNNTDLPCFYINDAEQPFSILTDPVNSMDGASALFTNGLYTIDPIYVSVTENEGITVGAKLENNNALWCIWDNFTLTYYGEVSIAEVILAEYVRAYNTALASAQAYVEVDMFDADKTALTTAISNNTINLNNTTEEELTQAAANLNAAATAAAKAVTNYNSYSDVSAAISGGTNIDVTSLISNLSFETGNLTGWTSTNGGNVANNNNYSGKVGTYFVERWVAAGNSQTTLSDGTLVHDAIVMPAGIYRISVNGQVQEQYNGKTGGGYYLYANDEKVEIGAPATYSVYVELEDKDLLNIKLALESCTGNWISCDNVTVTYFAQISDISAAAVNQATETLANASYTNVIGSERTSVTNGIASANAATTAEEHVAASEAIFDALATFTSTDVVRSYNLYAEELAIAQEISNTITVDEPATAAEALTAFKNLKVAEYNYVESKYPFSGTSIIGEFTSWTRTGTVNGAEKNEFILLTSQHWSGAEKPYYEQPATGWDNNAWTANYTKTTTLPAGNYIIKVAARAATGANTTARIICSGTETTGPIPNLGDTGLGITTSGEASFVSHSDDESKIYANNNDGRGWVWNYLPFTLNDVTEVTMTIVAEATGTHQWFSVCDASIMTDDEDNFKILEELGSLSEAVAAATLTKHANVGNAAFQYDEETDNTLWNAYDTAKSAADNFTLTAETKLSDVTTLVNNLTTAQNNYNNFTELNAPAEGQRFNIVLTYDGWTYDKKAMTYMANARTGEGDYNIQYAAEPNANYAQAFTFTKVEGNNYKLSQVDQDGNVRYITDQQTGGYGDNTASIRTTTDAEKAAAYQIIATATEGVYNIKNIAADNYIGSQDAGVYTVNSHINFNLVETDQAEVAGSLDAGKLATRIFPFKPAAIDGVKFYSATVRPKDGAEGVQTVGLTEVADPQANTPYILLNETNNEIDITQSGWGTASADSYAAGALTGVYTAAEIAADASNYILQTQKGVQAFYLVSGTPFTATPYRAYLTADNAEARIAFEFDGETTGISGVNAAEKKFDGAVYDLSGRKVAQPTRGLYIVNGKKVVIK